MTPTTSGQESSTRPTPFNLPLQKGDYGDDIVDDRGKLVANLYGDERAPETIAQRDYLVTAVNSFEDMLAALKAFSLFSAMIGEVGRPNWFKDDGAWTEFVIADEYRKAAIAKAEAQ